jgi:hypothetical protein
MMFWVPTPAKLGLGVSIISYAGEVSIGVGTDAGLVPDPGEIVNAFVEEFRALERVARSRMEQQQHSRLKSTSAGGKRKTTDAKRAPAAVKSPAVNGKPRASTVKRQKSTVKQTKPA